MTCSECSNPITQGVSLCTFCGAPFETETSEQTGAAIAGAVFSSGLRKLIPKASLTTTEKPKLWNPLAILMLSSLLLGALFGSVLTALNWHALGKRGWAVWSWMFLPLSLVLDAYVLPQNSPLWLSIFTTLGLWIPFWALPQVWYIGAYWGREYERRRWVLPVGLGLIFLFTWPKVVDGLTALYSSMSGSSNLSAPVVQTQPVQSMTVEEVAKEKSQYVFPVQVSYKETEYLVFSTEKRAVGSAVMIAVSNNAIFLLTNRHVVEVPPGASNVKRLLMTGSTATPFEIVGEGVGKVDLALLKVKSNEPLNDGAVFSATLDQIAVGEECVAIGNTLGRGISVTTGIVSMIEDMGEYKGIRTSAPISAGNSGGALFRRRDGALLGITTGSVDTHNAQNVNLVIPMDCLDKMKTLNPPQ